MTDPKPTRLRFQFSLRTLLVLITLSAVLCSSVAVGVKMRQVNREREVEATVKRWHGQVVWSEPSGPTWLLSLLGGDCVGHIETVSIGYPHVYDSILGVQTPITDAGLEQLKGLSRLRKLRLDENRITDARLEQLKDLGQLEELSLCGNPITDAGLEQLRSLGRLQQLLLIETKCTDAGIKELQKALPNCKIYR
jgi:hypothetical protein